MSKGKIIIINHYGITPDMPGATKHYDLAKFFAEKGEYSIEFWMCGYNHVTGKYVDGLKGLRLQHKYRENGIDIVKIKSVPDWGGLIMRQLNIMVFDFIAGIKVLFSRNVKCVVLSMPPITFFTTDALKIRRIKMVADVEDLWPLFMQDMGMKNKLATLYMEHFANHTYNSATAIEAVSEGMLSYVKKKIKNKSKKSWLSPLGVNLVLVEGTANKEKIDCYQWKNDFVIVYAGAHGKANDLESVLHTISAFEKKYQVVNGMKISFVFIGNGDNKEKLKKLARKLGLRSVYFEEAVPGNVIPQILMNADVCLTNLKKIESFKLVRPNKIFQYMAARKPIICGIWGEAQTIVEGCSAGKYIDFTNYSTAAESIYQFITQDNLSEYGENGYNYVSEFGDREKIFEDFYNNVKDVINMK